MPVTLRFYVKNAVDAQITGYVPCDVWLGD